MTRGSACFDELQGRHSVDGKTEWEMPIYRYPMKTGWDATGAKFQSTPAPRGGVDRVAERFRPAAAE